MSRIDAPAPPLGSGRSGITLRELEVLQALVTTGTAVNAARKLGVSQSAVSRRLTQLEARLGIRLFQRTGGRLVATVEALSINEQLQPVFDTLTQIASRMDEPRPAHRGTLAVVAPPTIAHRFLPIRVAAFSRFHPDLRIVFEVISSDALVTGVAEGRFDLGLTDMVQSHQGIHSEPLLATVAVCIIPKGHPLADRDAIGPADLDGEDFVALSRRHSSRAAADRMFERAGVSPRVVIETATSVSAVEFVRDGMGVSLINPFPVLQRTGSGVEVRPFFPPIAYSANFLMPSSHSPSAATLDFVEFVRSSLERGH